MGIATLARHASAVMIMAGILSPALAAAPDPVNGHFLDVSALLENRSDMATSPLLAGVQAPRLEHRSTFEDYQVNSAMLQDRQGEPNGFIVVVNQADGAFTALVNTSYKRGLVIGLADGTQTFHEQPESDPEATDFITDQAAEQAQRPLLDAPPPSAQDEQDTVLTVLAGFSDEALRQVGDPRSYALAQIETLNLSLRNSGIEHIKASLAGVSTTPTDYLIIESNLINLESIFPNHAKADLIAGFFASPPQNAIGLAMRYGKLSMTHISTTDTFAHEIGHNVGGGHCNPGDDHYQYGHSTGKYGSMMCRQGSLVLAFSNPDKTAPDGQPLGNAATADMARTWRTLAPGKSSGNGNDAGKPGLVYSLLDTNECLDVLDGNLNPGARVGLWKCDPNNPNQRWSRLYLNDAVQFRLAAKPGLCLYTDPAGGSNRNVVLNEAGCQHIVWHDENGSLRIRGNGEDLYLLRSSTNQLTASSRTSDDNRPGFSWSFNYPYSRVVNKEKNYCMEVKNSNYASGTQIVFARCVDNKPAQRWIREASGHIRSGGGPGMCLGWAGDSSKYTVLLPCGGDASKLVWKAAGQTFTTGEARPSCLHAESFAQPGSRVMLSLCHEATAKDWVIGPDR